MIRLSALFVAICMVLIAGSLGALLYLTVGLTSGEPVGGLGRGADRARI